MLEDDGLTVAQMLLTLEDSEERTRYLNARATLEALLALGAMPVINENDTVATAEIRYGDNDRLAARVAQMASADCLVLLSDVDGLYTADPNRDPGAEFIERVLHITPEIEAHGGPCRLRRGFGRHGDQDRGGEDRGRRRLPHVHRRGPPSASAAPHRGGRALHLVRAGIDAGRGPQAVDRRHAEARGRDPDRRRRAAALRAGKSLLPAGVIGNARALRSGDTVSVLAADGAEVARGIAAYSDADAARIMGRRSAEIEALLGFRGRDEMIHRDDLVMLQRPRNSSA